MRREHQFFVSSEESIGKKDGSIRAGLRQRLAAVGVTVETLEEVHCSMVLALPKVFTRVTGEQALLA